MKLKYDKLLSNVASNCNLRPSMEALMAEGHEVRILTRDSIAARIALPQVIHI